MKAIPAEARVSEYAPRDRRTHVTSANRHLLFTSIALGAFGLYWLSSVLLQARNGSMLFGADTPLYTWLGEGYAAERVTRFHPLTTALAMVWMKIVSPLTAWLARPHLLNALFAAIGAVGVWAALWTFAAVIPRRYVGAPGDNLCHFARRLVFLQH